MHIAVWVREIADTRDLAGEPLDGTGTPRWGEWESRVDPEDLNALEMALQWKDGESDLRVTALSVGEVRKLDVLRECLYRGADNAVRLAGPGPGGSVLEEARWVAAAVRRLSADGIFTGVQINEGEPAHKAVLAGQMLGWATATYVEAMEGKEGEGLRLRRAIEGGVQHIQIRLPAAVSVGVALLKEDPRAPRSAKAKLKLQHKKTPIPEWSGSELGIPGNPFGSAVRVLGFRSREQRQFPSRRIDGGSDGELSAMLGELRSQGLVR
jgi:electron transfer flavoprotein beta subunit